MDWLNVLRCKALSGDSSPYPEVATTYNQHGFYLLFNIFFNLKIYLMKKFKLNGKNLMMGLSFFVFMMLGSFSANAQWVNSSEAKVLIKGELATLQNDFDQAPTDQARLDIAFVMKYYYQVYHQIAEAGMEVSQAVDSSKPSNKAEKHSSGLIYFAAEDANFKAEVLALVATATDLLSN
jgi:hypothetical protein